MAGVSRQEVINLIDAAHYLSAVGTNTYTASANPTLRSYVTGKPYYVSFVNGNTGPSTLNIDGLGAKNIYKSLGVLLSSGDIPASSMLEVVYDGTAFQAIGGAMLFLTLNQKINSASSNFAQSII